MAVLRRKDLVYPALSYKIVGAAFDVHNDLGSGHHEKYYQRALGAAFRNRGLRLKEQVGFPLQYHGRPVGRQIIDFVVEDKIVVEIKKGNRFSRRHISQVLEYLKTSNLKLAILINFGTAGVTFRRLLNLY